MNPKQSLHWNQSPRRFFQSIKAKMLIFLEPVGRFSKSLVLLVTVTKMRTII